MKNIKIANILIGFLLGAIIGDVIEAAPTTVSTVNSVSQIVAKVSKWPSGPLWLVPDRHFNDFFMTPSLENSKDCHHILPSRIVIVHYTQLRAVHNQMKDRTFELIRSEQKLKEACLTSKI